MAEEAHRLWQASVQDVGNRSGVRASQELVEDFPVTTVEILDRRGEQALGMPAGRYFSLALPTSCRRSEPSFRFLVAALSALIRRCLPVPCSGPVLVAALGNPDVTPDAIGPLTAQHVLITRHLSDDPAFRGFRPVALCRTGVLGTTGMESAFQIQTLCNSLHPSLVLVVDALAGSDPSELCRRVQVSDAGLAPGSGVGNDRPALTRDTLGIPVVSLGVPTVVDASSLNSDDALDSLFVTPRYIDSAVRLLSRLLGYGINAALQPNLSIEDMDLLLE